MACLRTWHSHEHRLTGLTSAAHKMWYFVPSDPVPWSDSNSMNRSFSRAHQNWDVHVHLVLPALAGKGRSLCRLRGTHPDNQVHLASFSGFYPSHWNMHAWTARYGGQLFQNSLPWHDHGGDFHFSWKIFKDGPPWPEDRPGKGIANHHKVFGLSIGDIGPNL